MVDNYAKWRIVDPLLFYRTVRTVHRAQARLDDIIYAEMRVALGQYTLQDVVAEKRAAIMAEVTRRSTELVAPYGIVITDVRIKRTDLPKENAQAIYGRMMFSLPNRDFEPLQAAVSALSLFLVVHADHVRQTKHLLFVLLPVG